MGKFFKDLFTEDDNETFCAARVCGVASVFGYIGVSFIHVIHGMPVDFNQLGVGCGAVLVGAGAFVGIKSRTQKDQ